MPLIRRLILYPSAIVILLFSFCQYIGLGFRIWGLQGICNHNSAMFIWNCPGTSAYTFDQDELPRYFDAPRFGQWAGFTYAQLPWWSVGAGWTAVALPTWIAWGRKRRGKVKAFLVNPGSGV